MSASRLIHLHPADNVVIAAHSIAAGTTIPFGDRAKAVAEVPQGHKVAVTSVAPGKPILRYGQTIGFASRQINAGDWVHTHNVEAGTLNLAHDFCSRIPATPPVPAARTFQGYRRADGRAATRNYLAIISTVNCSATACKYAAAQFTPELLARFPHVDGVVPLVHKGGCAMQYGGADHQQLARTLGGFARHPNIVGYVIVGLGCETSQPSYLVENEGLMQLDAASSSRSRSPLVLTIQEQGGVRKTVDRAVAALKELLPEANRVERQPIPVSEIILGLECGGSDGASGVTANPALGFCSDLLVAHQATAILSEVPEIYGGEHLLTQRAVSPAVARKLLDRIQWWIEYTAKFNERIDINPSVGNKKGGLTTLYEKSLGAISKGGTTALRAVYEYAEQVTAKGFVVMDTPGYDPASVTGMIAGGANMICFTTGRGSCFGCKPVPSIKIATNTPMYDRMIDDMDINAGTILDGATIEEVGTSIFEKVIAVASGEQTKSEAQGIGDEEFCPWTWGPVT